MYLVFTATNCEIADGPRSFLLRLEVTLHMTTQHLLISLVIIIISSSTSTLILASNPDYIYLYVTLLKMHTSHK